MNYWPETATLQRSLRFPRSAWPSLRRASRSAPRTPADRRPPPPHVSPLDELQHLGGFLAHQRLAPACLDVEAHQRLGIGAAQIEAPLVEFHRQSVRQVDRLGKRLIVRAHPLDDRGGAGCELAIDLPARRE